VLDFFNFTVSSVFCLFAVGDELFSDSFPVELVNGVVYKVKGKVRTAKFLGAI
jgi:hypothetical protein